jgi:hypothetical protein
MAEVAQETSQEFWRPPVPVIADEVLVRQSAPAMAEACLRCGTEFLLGSRFCHTCGGRRSVAITAEARADAAEIAGLWEMAVGRVRSTVTAIPGTAVRVWSSIKLPAWLHCLQFHEIKRWVGLSTAPLIAFVIGIACVAGALLVGLLTASFVAGILLKKPSDPDTK